MDEFEKELKVGFLQEAQQIITDAEQCFLDLESNPSDQSILEKIFRLAHNLKGSSKAVGFDAMGAFTHEFESFLLQIKNGNVAATNQAVSLLLRGNDQLKLMVSGLTNDLNATFEVTELLEEIKLAQTGVFKGDASATASEPAPVAQEEMFSAEQVTPQSPEHEAAFSVDDVLALHEAQASAIEAFKAAAQAPLEPETLQKVESQTAPRVTPIAAPSKSATTPTTQPTVVDESIRVSLSRLEKLLNFVGEIVILQTMLREQTHTLSQQPIRKTISQLGKVTKEVQDISMSLRMIPLKQTFHKMQRIVRDTSQVLGKKVHLEMSGEETELDKTVLENLSDPLVHIIRNAVDHGIESNEKRKTTGKPEAGTVKLSAYHQSGKLVIEVKDDGGGIPGQVLLQKAIEKGIIKPGTVLSDADAVRLVFHPGFSTKSEISEVSGRGVGMDVVKTNIEKMSGEVHIQTALGEGTTFKILLPLTLSIIDGMVVTSETERFVIPLVHVHECLRPSRADIHFNSGFGEVLMVRGENLPMYRLNRLLGLPVDPKRDPMQGIAIIVRAGQKPFSVFVDDILGQSQIVIKQLGVELSHIIGYSGSAILGDGKPALILELPDLAARAKPLTQPVLKPVDTRPTELSSNVARKAV